MTRRQTRTARAKTVAHNNCGEDLECDGSKLCGLKFRNDVMKAHLYEHCISAITAEEIHDWIEDAGVIYFLKSFKEEEVDKIKNHGLLLLTLGNARSPESVMKLADDLVCLSMKISQGQTEIAGGPIQQQRFRIAQTVAGVADMGPVPGASWHGPDAVKSRTEWERKTVVCLLLSMVMDLHRSPEGYFAEIMGGTDRADYWKVYPVIDSTAPVPEVNGEASGDAEEVEASRCTPAAGDPIERDVAGATKTTIGTEEDERFVLSTLEGLDGEEDLLEAGNDDKSAGEGSEEGSEKVADQGLFSPQKSGDIARQEDPYEGEGDTVIGTKHMREVPSGDESETPNQKKPRLSQTTSPSQAGPEGVAQHSQPSIISKSRAPGTASAETAHQLPHKHRRKGGSIAKGGNVEQKRKRQRKSEAALTTQKGSPISRETTSDQGLENGKG